MPLDLGAKLGDQVLRFDAEEEREEVGSARLNDHGHQQGPQKRVEQVELTLTEHGVDQIPGGVWKHQPAESVENYQEEAEPDELAAGPDDLSEGVPEAVSGDLGTLGQTWSPLGVVRAATLRPAGFEPGQCGSDDAEHAREGNRLGREGVGLGRVFYALATLSTSSTVVSPSATTRRPSSLSNFIPASRART